MGDPAELGNNDATDSAAGEPGQAEGCSVLAAADALAIILNYDIRARATGGIGVAFSWLAEQHQPARKPCAARAAPPSATSAVPACELR
jgi:hypothetical protein